MENYLQEIKISKRLKSIFPTTPDEFKEGDINAVWEDRECIHLLWCDKGEVEKHHFTFGKRAKFYYGCPYNCQCFCETLRWLFLSDLVNSEKNWPNIFKNRETVVIEEKRRRIVFYLKLSDIEKGILSFSIPEEGDRSIKCSNDYKRPCAENPRVSYTTFRQFLTDRLSFLNKKEIFS